MILAITQQKALLETNPVLERSIRLRNPYVDPMSLIQVELIRRKRAAAQTPPKPPNSTAPSPPPSTASAPVCAIPADRPCYYLCGYRQRSGTLIATRLLALKDESRMRLRYPSVPRLSALHRVLSAPSPRALASNSPPKQTKALIEKREAIEKQLEAIAIIDRKVMVPMRDGKRMAADIYRPKDTSKKYPIIFVRTPYNFNFWDVRTGALRDMTAELDAVKRGYATSR